MQIKRIYGYLIEFLHYKIQFHTDEPNYDGVPVVKHGWSNTVYVNGENSLPGDASKPKGKCIVLSHCYNVNLMHNIHNDKSVTGYFHMTNLTPMMWYSKKKAILKTATYGTEFLAACTYMEHIVDIRNSFQYLGIPVHKTSYV